MDDAINKTAMQIWEKDLRLRMTVQSAVAAILDDHRDLRDREIEMRDVHDIALEAALKAVTMVVEGDAELKAARMERDQYKELAIRGLNLTPMQPMILKTDAV